MKRNFWEAGVDAWWMDSTEPALDRDRSDVLLECENCHLGENREFLNAYPYAATRNVYEAQRRESREKRVFILTRSCFAGQQSCAASTWTGDIEGDWETFRRQIPALLSLSASGIPYSTTDIGGFFVNYPGGNQNPEYQELYTRWFWFGAFSPIFRSHGTSTPREMWFFEKPYFEAQLACSRLRYRLIPYIYQCAYAVSRDHASILRPLAMEFPEDERACGVEDAYLFGESLLVHPVTEYGAREQKTYLPRGTDWYDFFDGTRCLGGTEVTTKTPLDRVPLFVRAGSVLVLAGEAQSTEDQSKTELELRVYSGSDGSAVFYQDSGDGYGYEEGELLLIPLHWSEKEKTLAIETAQGKTEMFDANKTFRILWTDSIAVPCRTTGSDLSFRLAKRENRHGGDFYENKCRPDAKAGHRAALD